MKQKIITIAFMLIGFAGITLQMYKYYTGELELNLQELALSMIFTVFVWKPRTLVSVFDKLVSKHFSKTKN